MQHVAQTPSAPTSLFGGPEAPQGTAAPKGIFGALVAAAKGESCEQGSTPATPLPPRKGEGAELDPELQGLAAALLAPAAAVTVPPATPTELEELSALLRELRGGAPAAPVPAATAEGEQAAAGAQAAGAQAAGTQVASTQAAGAQAASTQAAGAQAVAGETPEVAPLAPSDEASAGEGFSLLDEGAELGQAPAAESTPLPAATPAAPRADLPTSLPVHAVAPRVGLELRPVRAEASSEEPLRVEATERGPSFEVRVETPEGSQAPRAQSVNAPRAEGPRPTPLLDQVQVVLGPELSEARIRLDPPGLGNLFVQVKELKGELSATIEVERPEVLREIERLLPQLQDSFQRNGQTVTRIEVSLRPDGFAADAQGGGRHSGDAHDAHDSGAAAAPHRSSTPAEPRRAATLRLAPRGGLDTLA